MKLSGKCLCGRLTYSADAEPALVCVCHCKDCQRQAGTWANSNYRPCGLFPQV